MRLRLGRFGAACGSGQVARNGNCFTVVKPDGSRCPSEQWYNENGPDGPGCTSLPFDQSQARAGDGTCSDPQGDPNVGCYRPNGAGWRAAKEGKSSAEQAAAARAAGEVFDGNYGVNYTEDDVQAKACVSSKCVAAHNYSPPPTYYQQPYQSESAPGSSLVPAAAGGAIGYLVKQEVGALIGAALGFFFGGRSGGQSLLQRPKDSAEHWAIAWARAEAADASARLALSRARAAEATARQMAAQAQAAARNVSSSAAALWAAAQRADDQAQALWAQARRAQDNATVQGNVMADDWAASSQPTAVVDTTANAAHGRLVTGSTGNPRIGS